jgi:hypothetical protein
MGLTHASEEPDSLLSSVMPASEGESLSSATLAQAPLKLQPEHVFSYQLTKNEHVAFGYLRIQFECLQAAMGYSKVAEKPIFCLEAQLPGDEEAGREIFSHPLIVEAIESFFVTLYLKDGTATTEEARDDHYHPDHPGHCTSVHTRASFLDECGKQLVAPIYSCRLTRAGCTAAIISALEASGQAVPEYLRLVLEEESGRTGIDDNGLPTARDFRAVFAVDDAASAEVEIARLDGVLATRAGRIHAQSAVEVIYDPGQVSFSTLVRLFLKCGFCQTIYYQTNDERIASLVELERANESAVIMTDLAGNLFQCDHYDPKRALRQTPMRYVPLTDLQATKANRLVHLGKFNEAMHLLSPRQGLILMDAIRKAAKSLFEVLDVPTLDAWECVCNMEHPRRRRYTEETNESDSSEDAAPELYNLIGIADPC